MDMRRIQLMAEHGVTYPLWEKGDGLMSQDRSMLLVDLGVSGGLLDDLAAWQTAWENSRGRFSVGSHQAVGEQLVKRLQAEVKTGFKFGLWLPNRAADVGDRFRAIFVDPLWRLRHGPPPE